MAADEPDCGLLLYTYWRSSCSYRVRIALHHKRLAFESRAVHLVRDGGQQLAAAYADVNPMKEVPALVLARLPPALAGAGAGAGAGAASGAPIVLTQSPAILEFLEEAFPGRAPLLPRDALLRCRVRELCAVVACDTQPVQNLRVLKQVAGFFEAPADKEKARLEWAQRCIGAGLGALEVLMARSAGRFSVGDEVTLADVMLAPQVYNAIRFKVDLAAFPTVARVYAACMELDAFKAAQPSAQPDAEPE